MRRSPAPDVLRLKLCGMLGSCASVACNDAIGSSISIKATTTLSRGFS